MLIIFLCRFIIHNSINSKQLCPINIQFLKYELFPFTDEDEICDDDDDLESVCDSFAAEASSLGDLHSLLTSGALLQKARVDNNNNNNNIIINNSDNKIKDSNVSLSFGNDNKNQSRKKKGASLASQMVGVSLEDTVDFIERKFKELLRGVNKEMEDIDYSGWERPL